MRPLGMITGTGHMPRLIIQAYSPQPIFAIAYYDCTDPHAIENIPHQWFALGAVGAVLNALRSQNIANLVFAGNLKRPALSHIMPDKDGMRLLARLGLRWPGDNKLLDVIQNFLQEEGFTVLSPQEILPSLLYTIHSPIELSDQNLRDIKKGKEILDNLSIFDIGQGIAVQNGQILGIEAAEGTDQCIMRCGKLQNNNEPAPVYIKCAKIGQNEKIDLPAIGANTINALASAGFCGLAFEKGKTLILDRETVKNEAQKHKIFLWPI
jgi:DUF1009 family protein